MWRGRKSAEQTQAKAQRVALVVAFVVTAAAMLGGLSAALETELRQWRDTLQRTEASGDIAVLEIDGRSIQAIDAWPWPRSVYADALKELEQLGAAQIAFDVDFSSQSDVADDALFAQQLERMGGDVILPTFRQVNHADGANSVTETVPLPELAEHAFLASVNVHPSADGQVLRYPYGVTTEGIPRPSLASMIAGQAGNIDRDFRIDQAIDPTSIPRISFIDLLEERVDRDRIAGRKIIIGASAIELGDRYPTGLYGVIPGVLIQAQAAETLVQDRVREDLSGVLLLGMALAIFLPLMFVRRDRFSILIAMSAYAATSVVAAMILDLVSGPYLPLAPALLLLGAFIVTYRILQAANKLREARLTDTMSGLPNRTAMVLMRDSLSYPTIAVARIADLEQLEAIVEGRWFFEMDQSFAERMKALAWDGQIFRLERGLFGWIVPPDQVRDLEAYFATARALLNEPVMVRDQKIKLVANFGSCENEIAKAITAAENAFRTGQAWSNEADDLQEKSRNEQKILLEIDDALQDGSIWVAYQAKYKFADQKISGAECLARWESPTMGRIGPDEFIPLLERKGRMHELTQFVLRDALVRLVEAERLGHELNLAVNVSAQLLTDTKFVDEVVGLIAHDAAKTRGQLTIEVTESAPLSDAAMAREALNKFRDAGARISIDDYGTGQATLTYLQGFPADEVKLDQTFVKGFTSSKTDEIMVRSTIEMAHALGFQIVAEGIEDEEILDALAALNCDYGQGWHIGKPVAWDAFVANHLAKSEDSAAA